MVDFLNYIKNIVSKSKGLFSLGFATIISNGLGGIFWLYMSTLLGTEDYGKISYFISIAIIASTISLAGMSNTMIIYKAKGEKIQPVLYLIGIISPIITSIILFFVFLDELSISLYVIGYVMFTLVTSELIGLKLYVKYSKLILVQKGLFVTLALVFYHLMGFQGVIWGIAISFLPFFIIMFKTFKIEKIDFSILKNKYRFIVNSYLLDLTNAFNGSLDKIIIAPILGYVLLGNYQLGIQFIALLGIFPGIFYQYILPHDASGNSTKTIKKIMILISIVVSIGSLILSPFVIPVLFPNFTEVVEIIQIMSFSIVTSAIVSAYVSKYLGLTKSNIVIVGSGFYLVVQIPTLLILGELWGVNGAAFSVLIASGVHAAYFIIIDQIFKNQKKSNRKL